MANRRMTHNPSPPGPNPGKAGRWEVRHHRVANGRLEFEEEDGRLYVLLKDTSTGEVECFDVERRPNTSAQGQAEREAKARGWMETWAWGWTRKRISWPV